MAQLRMLSICVSREVWLQELTEFLRDFPRDFAGLLVIVCGHAKGVPAVADFHELLHVGWHEQLRLTFSHFEHRQQFVAAAIKVADLDFLFLKLFYYLAATTLQALIFLLR